MHLSKILRPVAVIVLSLAIAGLSTSVVRASNSSMDWFCYWWNVSLEPPSYLWCSADHWNWKWNGEYDVSSTWDPLGYATDICNDLFYSCWDTCESKEFQEAALAKVNDAAYPCTYDLSCIETWGNPSCQQAETGPGTFSCSCQYFNVCAPCD